MEGNTPKVEEPNTGSNLEKLYMTEEFFTFKVSGIDFKIRDLSADELFEIMRKATVDGEVVQRLYAKEIMKACILEPKLDFKRELRGTTATTILSEIQDALGLTEMAQKKLQTR